MTDKELLELAAKAAGIEVHHWTDGREPHECPVLNDGIREDIKLFDPLTDDGDALRLAVKLRLQIQINEGSIVVYRPQLEDGTTPPECYEYPDSVQGEDYEVLHINHDKATRRAIVRAAAEIGKGMK